MIDAANSSPFIFGSQHEFSRNFHNLFPGILLCGPGVGCTIEADMVSDKIGWNVWRTNDETVYKDGLAEDLMEIVYNV
jgi:hypothetical protein